MPQELRGHVFYYTFGPAYGAELADNRAALIISNDETNSGRRNYIALPTSTSEPPLGQLGNHVRIQDAGDWASIQKITTVDHRALGDHIGKATPDELRQVVTAIQKRLGTPHRPGIFQTAEGPKIISPGVVFETSLTSPHGTQVPSTMALIDYNDGNKISITIRLHFPPIAPNSPVSVPVQIQATGQAGSAMVNQIKPIHLSEYDLSGFEEIWSEHVEDIKDRLLTVIDE